MNKVVGFVTIISVIAVLALSLLGESNMLRNMTDKSKFSLWSNEIVKATSSALIENSTESVDLELLRNQSISQQIIPTPVESVEGGKQASDKGKVAADSMTSEYQLGLLGTPTNPLTILVYVTGEMGNMISKITYGYALQWMLQDNYNITTELVLRNQQNGKWRKASLNVKQCFPVSREWSFERGNTDDFNIRNEQQKAWLGDNYNYFHFATSRCDREECILENVQFIVENLHNATGKPYVGGNYNISLPFIYSDEFATISYFNDRYASRIAEMWKFDVGNPACCAVKADPDESVLHIRHFIGEMPRKGRRMGYEELSPAKVANELFGHLQSGDKVALASRFPSEYLTNFSDAFIARGVQVRQTPLQSPTQDLCFLMSAEKEFAGYSMSSYAVWAAYLGNATKARLYSVKSPDRIARLGEEEYFFRYNWTNPTMKRIMFEEYNSEEQDQLKKNEKG